MYSLKDHQNPAVAALKARAIINPEAFVLKPLKEGGGNNFFNEDIVKMLQTLSEEEIGRYLLMEKVIGPQIKTLMLRSGQITYTDSITELGVFSCVISNSETG